MARSRWKWIAGIGGVALVLVGIPVGVLGATFGPDAPLQDGKQVGDATTIVDGFVAAFSLETGDGGVLLVDAGNDTTGAALTAGLKAQGHGLQDVRAVLVTHGHGDHIGACALLPDAEIVSLEAEKPLIEGTAAATGLLTRFTKNDGSCEVDRTVHDGDTLTYGQREVRVFAVPGHTGGSAAYLVDGVLFLGDEASANRKGQLTGSKWIFSDDTAQGTRSLKALAGKLDPSEVQWLAFAHTAPLQGLAPLQAFAANAN